MKTKAQKKQAVEQGSAALKTSATVLFTDFTGLTANEMNAFRRTLKGIGASLRVMKKRLVRVMLDQHGVAFDPKGYEGQLGVVFSPKDSVETAGTVYQFGKQFAKREVFKILGGFDASAKELVDRETMVKLGQLPPRQVLLGQLVGMLASPIRSLLFVMDQKAKKG